MTTNTLISDPAVALELGRRLAANAKRPLRMRTRLGLALRDLLSERNPLTKTGQR